jgi:signal peptidase I
VSTIEVFAGFPSPTEDCVESRVDLNRHLIKHQSVTFLARVEGDSMIGAGIHHGDLLIVDRSLTAVSDRVVVPDNTNWVGTGELVVGEPSMYSYWQISRLVLLTCIDTIAFQIPFRNTLRRIRNLV